MASAFVVPHEINILASSDPSNGASDISEDGSRFTVRLDEPLQVPKEALNVTIDIETAEIWWTVPNILTGINDKLYITAPNVGDVLTPYVVVIPQGLYDLTGLNQAIHRELTTLGAKVDPEPVISLSPDDATQKVELRLPYLGSSIDFTQADTFRDILGFNSQIIGPTIVAPEIILADNTANFNVVNYFLLHCDLVGSGIRINNRYSQTVAQVLIDVAPGSQITYQPFNPARINVDDLAGATRNQFRVWLTDGANRQVNTSGEFYSMRIAIRYLMPHIVR